jgi:hypothetical protein
VEIKKWQIEVAGGLARQLRLGEPEVEECGRVWRNCRKRLGYIRIIKPGFAETINGFRPEAQSVVVVGQAGIAAIPGHVNVARILEHWQAIEGKMGLDCPAVCLRGQYLVDLIRRGGDPHVIPGRQLRHRPRLG